VTGDDGLQLPGVRSAVELTRFQEDAVRKARRILARYDGVLVADSVGLGIVQSGLCHDGQDLDRQETAGGHGLFTRTK